MNLVESVLRGEDGHEEAFFGITDRSDIEGMEAGVAAKEICRKHNLSDATFYTWRKKYRGMETEDIRRLKQLEAENQKLKRLLADSMLDNDALKAALSKKY